MNDPDRASANVSTDLAPICRNCGARMHWDAYVSARRPDVLRRGDERAPIFWAWHCRCGMWIYGRPHRAD